MTIVLACAAAVIATGCGSTPARGSAVPGAPSGPADAATGSATVSATIGKTSSKPVGKPTTSQAAARAPVPMRGPGTLIGAWTVRAPGVPANTSLILGDSYLEQAGDLGVVSSCGLTTGMWKADGAGGFVGNIDGGVDACFISGPADRTPAWLRSAAAYRSEGTARVLLGSDGRTIARLLPGAHPKPVPNVIRELTDPPVLTRELARQLAPAAPLATGVRPVTRAELVRRWRPAAGNRKAFVAFHSDGSWNGSDGCNGSAGRYQLGAGSGMLVTSGASTLIGCDNSPAPTWVASAERAGLIGNQLALYDQAGKLLGVLRPA